MVFYNNWLQGDTPECSPTCPASDKCVKDVSIKHLVLKWKTHLNYIYKPKLFNSRGQLLSTTQDQFNYIFSLLNLSLLKDISERGIAAESCNRTYMALNDSVLL
jgi:hypothetical protein